jgi:hypothetical protein
MVKKHLWGNLLTSIMNHLLKLVEFVLKRRIQADDQETRLVQGFSLVCRNLKAGKQGIGWCYSCDSMEGATFVFPAVQISSTAGVKAQWSTMFERHFYQYVGPPEGNTLFMD